MELMSKLKELYNKFKKIFSPDSQHPKVGTLIQNDFIGSVIVVTRFVDDSQWYFKKFNMEDRTSYGAELRAGSKYTYFVRNNKIVEEANHDK